MKNYHVRLNSQNDLEEFTAAVKTAVVQRIVLTERFSGVRLSNTSLSYNEWFHKDIGHTTWLGYTHTRNAGDRIEVRQVTNAVDLAGTVVHELAHALVGAKSQHDANWHDACKAIGYRHPAEHHVTFAEDDFEPDIWAAIVAAIERLAREHPTLVFDPNIEIPLPPGRELLPFQVDGVRRMLEISNSGKHILLADEPGLGKTVQGVALMNIMHPKRTLIVCPNGLKLVWKRHIDEWCTHPDIRDAVEVAHSNFYLFGDHVIMNYECVVKWADALRKQEWDLIIFDEMHFLKNASAKRSRACYALIGERIIGMTGTPIVNYPDEIFPLIHKLDPETWPEYARFAALHKAHSGKFGRNLPRLNARLRASIMVRRQKKDVLTELPRKRRSVIEFECDDATRKLIEEEKKLFNTMKGEADTEAVKWINELMNADKSESTAESDFDWAELIESLKYTKRYAFEEMARIAHLIALAKVPLVIEHVENILEEDDKVVVFGHHRDVLMKIAEHFAPHSVLLLGGGAAQAEAVAAAGERFNNDPECKVFVGGITIAQGYSLRGSSRIIFVEEDWIPGNFTQAEDRSHGINRGDAEAKSLLIQHLVYEDSLDTYKAKLNINKQKSIDKAVNK